MKTILKAIITIVCIGLLIWNAGQVQKMQDGSYVQEITYEAYAADDPAGMYREASIIGLEVMVTDTQIVDGSFVSTNYCIVLLEDYTIGAVKFNEDTYRANNYNEWEIEDEADLQSNLEKGSFRIRGKTEPMEVFVLEDFTDSEEEVTQADIDSLNETFQGITLLNTDGIFQDKEVITPELPSLGEHQNKVILVAVVAGGLLLVDIIKNAHEKRKKQAEE